MSTLTNDIARCDGVTYYREGCEHCLRRTAPRTDRVVMMSPPPIIAFECEHLIEPPLDSATKPHE